MEQIVEIHYPEITGLPTSMASQKVRPTALRRFFRTSTYLMQAFAPEKPPGLVGRNFCLAIL